MACGGSDRASTIDGLKGDVTSGQSLYQRDCVACHGDKGQGTASGKTLIDDHAKDHSDGELADTIIDGNGDMPSFGNQYTDQEISDVLAYIRTLQ